MLRAKNFVFRICIYKFIYIFIYCFTEKNDVRFLFTAFGDLEYLTTFIMKGSSLLVCARNKLKIISKRKLHMHNI